jgi:hypothetical protein
MAAETDRSFQRSSWLFLLGVAVFLGSAGLALYDLVSGNELVRGLAANGGAAALLVGLAGIENLSDPESHVETRGDALRAVLLFYGLYLLLAGLVVVVAAVLGHPDVRLGAAYVAVGGVVVALTFLTGGAESGLLDRVATLAGILGIALAVAAIGLFVYDLVTGRDVLRGIVVNGVGAGLFILWTAYDMPSDPDSGVDTTADALGMALLFYGGYLLVAGIAVVVTGVLGHERGGLGLLYLVLAVAPLVLGLLLAPLDVLTEYPTDETPGDDTSEETPASSDTE